MKKKKGGGGANWMDTYGDMVTLLLCFFVLLYSISTISEDKWKAMVQSFNPDAIKQVTVTTGNDGPNADPEQNQGIGVGVTQEEVDSDMENLYKALKDYVNQNGVENQVVVEKDENKIYVTFNQTVFFDGDDYSLREESKPILESVGDMLTSVSRSVDELRILGHTAQELPDRQNDVFVDRMLSAQRAANTLSYVQQHCNVEPRRMVSEGYGQWHPIGDNNTVEGRAKNRRVEMIVSGRDIEKELSGAVSP